MSERDARAQGRGAAAACARGATCVGLCGLGGGGGPRRGWCPQGKPIMLPFPSRPSSPPLKFAFYNIVRRSDLCDTTASGHYQRKLLYSCPHTPPLSTKSYSPRRRFPFPSALPGGSQFGTAEPPPPPTQEAYPPSTPTSITTSFGRGLTARRSLVPGVCTVL